MKMSAFHLELYEIEISAAQFFARNRFVSYKLWFSSESEQSSVLI